MESKGFDFSNGAETINEFQDQIKLLEVELARIIAEKIKIIKIPKSITLSCIAVNFIDVTEIDSQSRDYIVGRPCIYLHWEKQSPSIRMTKYDEVFLKELKVNA